MDSRLAHAVERAGRPGGAAVCREWLNALIEQDGMVDSFTELHPSARGRYTCWSQYLNERYSNCAVVLTTASRTAHFSRPTSCEIH